MLKKERQAYILHQVNLHNKVLSSSLCSEINVSEDTIRRDLQALQTDLANLDGEIAADTGIRLKRGGNVVLPPGAVTTFVPNPDHIHQTGVAADRPRAVSLHLYGRTMSSFHIYDVDKGTRQLINVAHQES